MKVELWAGRIPVIGRFAHHYWFVVEADGARDRWEVWQSRGRCPVHWGYLHKNLMPPDAWIERMRHWRVTAWTDEDAEALKARIEGAPETYPWCDRYRPWPGPNSNTFAQWVLENTMRLPRQAIGRNFIPARRASARPRSE